MTESETEAGQCATKFVYLSVKCGKSDVAALLDKGASCNLMSKSLYNALNDDCKSKLMCHQDVNKIIVADNHEVGVLGTA